MDAKYLQQAQRLLAHPLMSTFELHEKAGVFEGDTFYLWDGTRYRADWIGEDLLEYIQLVRGMNDPLETRIYLDVLAELKDQPIVVLEAGAGGGQFSLHALRYHPQARAILVEAHPRHYLLTCDHMVMNQVAHASQVLHAAVSAREGQIARFRSDAGYGSYLDPTGDIIVPTVSVIGIMRDLKIPYLHILHMDIQGDEAAVLRSSKRLLAKFQIYYLFVSTHTEKLHESCKHLLRTCHYHLLVDVSPANSAIGGDGLIVAKAPVRLPDNNKPKSSQTFIKRYQRALQRRLAALCYALSRQFDVISNG